MSTTFDGLVVPIRVQALTVSEIDASRSIFAVPNADFSRLPAKGVKTGKVYISQTVQNQPFDTRQLAEGIYLHWQLPKALRHISTGDDGSTEIPDAPNRWLVIRTIVDKSSGQTSIKSWILESDYLSIDTTYSMTSVPWNPDVDSPNTWRYLGRVYDYEEWVKGGNLGKYYPRLNATGYGILDFSGAFQNCENVFGMYDGTLNTGFDAGKQTLSYTVMGWYSNPANDPLSKQTINGSSNSFGWIFDDDHGTLSPGYTLLQGCVRSIDWNPHLPNGYFPDANDPANVNISIGNTAPEALSAMVRWLVEDAGQELKHVERLMNAVQIGSLQTLGQPGGLSRFEEELFSAEYGGFQGGELWDIEPAQGQNAAVALDASIGPKLRQLNQVQDEYNTLAQQRTALAQQVFEDWTKFMIIQHMGPSNQYPDINDVFDFLNSEIQSLNEISDRMNDALNTINALTVSITTALPETIELVNMPSPRYYRPNDPVLLLSGKDAPEIPPDFGNTIICVLTSKLITKINFPAGLVQGSAASVFDASWLPSFGNTSNLPYDSMDKAWRALLMVNGDASPLLTTLLAQNGGPDNPASINRDETFSDINLAQQQWLQAKTPDNGITFNGPTPQGDILVTLWKVPWNPIAVSWAFDFYPLVGINRSTGEGYPKDTVIQK